MLLPPHVNHIPLLLLAFFFFSCPVEMVWATQRDHSLLPSYLGATHLSSSSTPTQPILHMNCGKKKKEERERETKTRNGRFQLMNPPSSFSLFLSLKLTANGWMELFPSPISHCCYCFHLHNTLCISQSFPPPLLNTGRRTWNMCNCSCVHVFSLLFSGKDIITSCVLCVPKRLRKKPDRPLTSFAAIFFTCLRSGLLSFCILKLLLWTI